MPLFASSHYILHSRTCDCTAIRLKSAYLRGCSAWREAKRSSTRVVLVHANEDGLGFQRAAIQEQNQTKQTSHLIPVTGRFRYSQLRVMPEEQLKFELSARGLSNEGGRQWLVLRLYAALFEENMVASAALESEGGFQSEVEGARVREVVRAGEVCPLPHLQRSCSGTFLSQAEDSVMSNANGAQMVFLWGHTAANGIRVATSAALRTKRSVWLFDCGEDTQRHLLKKSFLSWVKIDRIFVSSMSSESVLGLPGMLCTISAARAKGHENADTPLHVYGPAGLVDYINNMLSMSQTYLLMPVIIHELSTRPVPPEVVEAGPQLVNKRARLYAMPLPPDQLNPQGYYDGEVRTMLARHSRKKVGGGIDARASTLPLTLPEPGDPSRTDVKIPSMVWTIRADHEFYIKAAPLRHRQPCFGFLIREADRSGRLDPEAAVALGVTPGEDFASLKEGRAVRARDGTLVLPEQVVGPVKRGRRWAVVGPCQDSSLFPQAVGEGCDLLVHSMEPALSPAPMSAAELAEARLAVAAAAGACASTLGAKELVMWQPSSTFLLSNASQDPDYPRRAIEAAQSAFGGGHVSLAGSFTVHQFDQQGDVAPVDSPAGDT